MAALAALLVGCGGAAEDEATPKAAIERVTVSSAFAPAATATNAAEPKGAARWSDEIEGGYSVSERDVYELAESSCRVAGPKQVGRDFGSKRDPASAAAAYAETYVIEFQAPALAGCLDGFRAR